MDVRYIAKLSKLYISDEELQCYEKDMRKITDMLGILPDSAGEHSVPYGNAMILREDIARECEIPRDELLMNAPCVNSGCISVPKTVE